MDWKDVYKMMAGKEMSYKGCDNCAYENYEWYQHPCRECRDFNNWDCKPSINKELDRLYKYIEDSLKEKPKEESLEYYKKKVEELTKENKRLKEFNDHIFETYNKLIEHVIEMSELIGYQEDIEF